MVRSLSGYGSSSRRRRRSFTTLRCMNRGMVEVLPDVGDIVPTDARGGAPYGFARLVQANDSQQVAWPLESGLP